MKKQWLDEGQRMAVAGWQDLKYGMFIHYGLFSICGGMWNGQKVEKGYSEQILAHGDVPQADYERLARVFTADKFDADQIASFAKAAGMSYIVIVAKHHDGFCLFDTKTTDYNCVHSPCGRDLVGELAKACRKSGLKLGLYYSWIDWHYPFALPISPHNSDRIPDAHMDYNMAQLSELLSNYGPICELWMDMGAPTPQQSKAVCELAHRLQPGIMVNGRVWNDYGDFITMADNAYPDCELDVPWQTPATIYHATWGYRSWQERTGLEDKIRDIAASVRAVVEGGGNYLLNIGPMGDGSVVPFERDVLLGIGRALAEGGLARKMRTAKARPLSDSSQLSAREGVALSRYSGAEYYSLHRITTGFRWDVLLPEEGDYSIRCELEEPLAEECKLCLDTEDDTFIFSLKRGDSSMVITSKAHFCAGEQEIRLYTPGSPVKRPEFPAVEVIIRISRL